MKYQAYNVLAFILLGAISKQGSSWTIGASGCLGFVREPPTVLYGFLDEVGDGQTSDGSSNDSLVPTNDYEKLFEDIVFYTGDSLRLIKDRLDDFADPGFLEWLRATQAKCEDAEEFEAIKELRTTIDDAVKAKEDAETIKQMLEMKREQEAKKRLEEAQQVETSTDSEKMSAADVLKKANEIEKAVVNAEASEDGLPDDFMRDAKAVCGLAGFNNKGQMRVGGN